MGSGRSRYKLDIQLHMTGERHLMRRMSVLDSLEPEGRLIGELSLSCHGDRKCRPEGFLGSVKAKIAQEKITHARKTLFKTIAVEKRD